MFLAGPKTPADAHARAAGASPDQHNAPGPAAQPAGLLPVKLSATRQADVSDYKGKVYVRSKPPLVFYVKHHTGTLKTFFQWVVCKCFPKVEAGFSCAGKRARILLS